MDDKLAITVVMALWLLTYVAALLAVSRVELPELSSDLVRWPDGTIYHYTRTPGCLCPACTS